jgi:hypothetical protein
MEQRRFFEARGEESGEWLVRDGKRHPPRVICRCVGWNAPKNAALIAAALEAHNSELYSKFPLDGSGQLDEQPAVKVSSDAEGVLRRASPISVYLSGTRQRVPWPPGALGGGNLAPRVPRSWSL